MAVASLASLAVTTKIIQNSVPRFLLLSASWRCGGCARGGLEKTGRHIGIGASCFRLAAEFQNPFRRLDFDRATTWGQ